MATSVPETVLAAAGETCALCGCETASCQKVSVARPRVGPHGEHGQRLYSPLERERVEAWLARVPARAVFCGGCLRAHAAAAAVYRHDPAVREQSNANLFFRAFGHPSREGERDWRATRRAASGPAPGTAGLLAPLALMMRSMRAAKPAVKRGLSRRQLRRWLKVQRAGRLRLRKRAAQFAALAGRILQRAAAACGRRGLRVRP